MPIKKPSTMTANCTLLLRPFLIKKCKHLPDMHLPGDGHPRELREAQIWTWQEANLIISGIMATRKWHKTNIMRDRAFPVTCAEEVARAVPGVEQEGPHPEAPDDPKACKCYGCRNKRPATHWQHNRVIKECTPTHATFYS